jgi:hypothetical protein
LFLLGNGTARAVKAFALVVPDPVVEEIAQDQIHHIDWKEENLPVLVEAEMTQVQRAACWVRMGVHSADLVRIDL